MYRESPFRAGNIQKLMYGGANDDKPEPISTEDVNVGFIEKGNDTWTSKWGPCTGHSLMMVGVVVLLLIGLTVAAIIRDRNIARHKKIASLRRDNVFNKDLPEFSIVRSPKMNKYMVLLIVPILSILAICTYYGLLMTGKLGDCSYSKIFASVFGVILVTSILMIASQVFAYKKSQKGLGGLKKRVNDFETFVNNNLYKYNYNTAANRLERIGGSTSSPEAMYNELSKALSNHNTVNKNVRNAVKAALDTDKYLTTTMPDHELNLQNIMYTLSLYQFMMDDKVDKNKVNALFSLRGVYSGSFRIADHMRAYTLTNMGKMEYIDNVANYINKYSTIRMGSDSMRTLKMKVAKQLHNTSARAAGIKAYKGWDNLKRLDNDYLGIYILGILIVPIILMFYILGYVAYIYYKKWSANRKAAAMAMSPPS